MKNKKLIFTFIGLIVLILFMTMYLIWGFINNTLDAIIVTAWITNLMLLISVYNKANVEQKKVISQHYNTALDDKGKG